MNLCNSNTHDIAPPFVIHVLQYVAGRKFSIQEMQDQLRKCNNSPKLKFESMSLLEMFLGMQLFQVL